ncbi:DUF2235 domain-containing protein [Rhodanobacter sp. A1T4]|jgi:hypothetical protein|uniref:phospholipase effector Tle1 domain-containing protein n=1 Tax=Rhodanobacter sp. A1T4 TaxID=2723087 RepID=UPI001608FAC5|nr:DUF2235 domain-containing protein [Rhodanobacter sp. A1T4]MBB6248954.1 hypothetical protein [Rhodanobacter sp. A1T4]
MGGMRRGNGSEGESGGGNPSEELRTMSEGNRVYQLTDKDMHLYTQARTTLSDFQTPKLVSLVEPTAERPGSRLFVAAFDGTGNDADNDPVKNQTNVAHIRKEIEASRTSGATNGNVAVGYLRGPGTQGNALPLGHEDRAVGASVSATRDSMRGSTTQERAERMYDKFCTQATVWKSEHPKCEIAVSSVGFSRGAEEAALFTRLVHERGIRNMNVTDVKADGAYLVPPKPYGQTAQTVVLFDPVATGTTERLDRHLPSSVISGIQLYAGDEKRNLFKGDPIIPAVKPGDPAPKEHVEGTGPQSRLVGLMMPGSHSDVGGSYALNGASARAGNFGVDYLNSLSDKPFISNIKEPAREDTYRHNSMDAGGSSMVWTLYKANNTGSMYRHWTGPIDRKDTTPGSRAYVNQERPDPVNPALSSKYAFTGSITHNSKPPQEMGNASRPEATNARNDQAPRQGTSRESTDSVLNTLSRAASSNDMNMAQAVLSNSSNPALAAREQGAQAQASQRQQAQQSAEPQPQREPTPPTQNAGQPRR